MTKPTIRFHNPFTGRNHVCFDCRTASKRGICRLCRKPMRYVLGEVPRRRDDKGWTQLRAKMDNHSRRWEQLEDCTNQRNTRQPRLKSWRGILKATTKGTRP